MPEGLCDAVVIINEGIITDITDHIPDGIDEVIDLEDKILMAGVIDPHVHINEPGRTEWEGFDTATKAAIAGGVTTLIDMPLNSSPVTTTVAALNKKREATKGQLHTNCGFWGGIIPGNIDEIQPLADNGVRGFKAFLTHSGIDEFPNVTESDLRKAMPIIARNKLPLLVHCELTNAIPTGHGTINVRSYANYLASRPRQWEDDAIALMIRLCEEFDCPVHIVHLSSSNSLHQVEEAKKKGLPLTAETGQHYLYFNAESIAEGQTQFKCAPPIREKENNEQLWQALKDGIIDFVATDHSPCTPELKELSSGNFMKAWGGIASLQFALPVLWTSAKARHCSVTNIAKWLCESPAKLARLSKRKGQIKKGFDADLIAWSDRQSFKVTEESILHKHKVTPYLGETLFGVVEQTFLAGEKVFDKGRLVLNRGCMI